MEAKEKVKRKLWTFGYRVKDVSEVKGLGCDLIVDEHYQLRVVEKKNLMAIAKGAENYSLEKVFNELKKQKRNQVTAVVDGDEITYLTSKAKETSPLKAFPKVDS